MGAIVLFGKEPVKFIQQCRIRITEMPEGKPVIGLEIQF